MQTSFQKRRSKLKYRTKKRRNKSPLLTVPLLVRRSLPWSSEPLLSPRPPLLIPPPSIIRLRKTSRSIRPHRALRLRPLRRTRTCFTHCCCKSSHRISSCLPPLLLLRSMHHSSLHPLTTNIRCSRISWTLSLSLSLTHNSIDPLLTPACSHKQLSSTRSTCRIRL